MSDPNTTTSADVAPGDGPAPGAAATEAGGPTPAGLMPPVEVSAAVDDSGSTGLTDLTGAMGGAGSVPAPAVPPSATSARKPERRRGWRGLSRYRRRALTAAFIIGVLIAAGALVLVALTRSTPSWWQSVDRASPKLKDHAERLEAGLSNALTQPRDSAPWTARLSETDANIWLNTRLRKWLESQPELGIAWPEQLTDLRVRFEEGRITVGARVEQHGASQVFSATLSPAFRKDGSLWMPADNVALGRLKIPASWVLGSPGDESRGEPSPAEKQTGKVAADIAKLPATRRVLAAFAGRNAVRQDPTIRLPDGRRVRILGIRSAEGKVLITFQTLQRSEPRSPRAGETRPSSSSSPAGPGAAPVQRRLPGEDARLAGVTVTRIESSGAGGGAGAPGDRKEPDEDVLRQPPPVVDRE